MLLQVIDLTAKYQLVRAALLGGFAQTKILNVHGMCKECSLAPGFKDKLRGKDLVTRYKGHISIQSKVGRGTCVTIAFPWRAR